jgi:hypothetical protein
MKMKSLIDESVEFEDEHAVISIVVRGPRHAILVLETIEKDGVGYAIKWWDFIPLDESGNEIPDYDTGLIAALMEKDYPAKIRDCPYHDELGFGKLSRCTNRELDEIGGRDKFFEKLGWSKRRFRVWKVAWRYASKLQGQIGEDEFVTGQNGEYGAMMRRLWFRLSGKTHEKKDIKNKKIACNCLTWIFRVLNKIDLPADVKKASIWAKAEGLVAHDPVTYIPNKRVVDLTTESTTRRCTVM